MKSYEGLAADYVHEAIDHAKEYVRGNVHTNGLENYWSLLKRCIRGTYVSVEPFHLFRYLDEEAFRFNERKREDETVKTDGERFVEVLRMIAGQAADLRSPDWQRSGVAPNPVSGRAVGSGRKVVRLPISHGRLDVM